MDDGGTDDNLKVICVNIVVKVDLFMEHRHWITDEEMSDMLCQQMINSSTQQQTLARISYNM